MTGPELRKLREHLGEAIGRPLTAADMAKLCGLATPDGANTIRRWEVTGPSAQATGVLRVLAMASEHYPILDRFNVFDRHDVAEKDRPARKAQFREQMREDIRRRLA